MGSPKWLYAIQVQMVPVLVHGNNSSRKSQVFTIKAGAALPTLILVNFIYFKEILKPHRISSYITKYIY